MKGFEPSTFAMARRRSSQLSYIRALRAFYPQRPTRGFSLPGVPLSRSTRRGEAGRSGRDEGGIAPHSDVARIRQSQTQMRNVSERDPPAVAVRPGRSGAPSAEPLTASRHMLGASRPYPGVMGLLDHLIPKPQMVDAATALPGRDTPMAVPARHEVLGTPLQGPW